MRRILIVAAALAGVGLLLVAGAGFWLYTDAKVSTVGELEFENELRVPPLLEPQVDAGGTREFDLELQSGKSELLPGKESETWGANGTYLAPTIRARDGDRVQMNVTNSIGEETTTIHWHGAHLPAAADGGPHQTIAPGATWTPSWTIDQPAATLWYHPHPHEETEEQVYRGIAGMLLVEDERSEGLPLPRRYGVDDLPLIVQDKKFEEDGSLDLSQRIISPTGLLGSEILVNGTHDPYFEVSTELVRLRLLNASNARVYEIGFDDDRSFELIAADSGLLGSPRPLERLPLSPGERAEIVVAFEPGDEVVLRSFEPDLGSDPWNERFSGGDDSFDLLQFRAAERLERSAPLPERLAAGVRPAGVTPPDAVQTRRLELTGSSSINGEKMDLERIDQVAPVGGSEIWEVSNESGIPHNFHPHGTRFTVLEYGGEEPPSHLTGPKDTVYVPPNETVRLAVDLPGYADPSLPYMFHCHVLEHEDGGMMGQLVVVEPGQEPGSVDVAADED